MTSKGRENLWISCLHFWLIFEHPIYPQFIPIMLSGFSTGFDNPH